MAGALADSQLKAEKALNSFYDQITITTHDGTSICLTEDFTMNTPICLKVHEGERRARATERSMHCMCV
jgi:hypothetical protein